MASRENRRSVTYAPDIVDTGSSNESVFPSPETHTHTHTTTRGPRHGSHAAANIIAQLPSHQPFSDTHLTVSRARSLSHQSRSSLRRRSTMRTTLTRGPTSRVPTSGLGVDLVDSAVEVEDEEMNWRRRQTIKDMTTSLTLKKHFRDRLKSSPTTKLSGYEKWKLNRSVEWERFKVRFKDALSNLEVWRGSFKEVEGHFGTGIMSYFRFVKWIFFLNVYIAVITFCVITLPHLILEPHDFLATVAVTPSSSQQAGDNMTNVTMTTESLTTLTMTTVIVVIDNGTSSSNDTSGGTAALSGNTDYVGQAQECTLDYRVHLQNKSMNATPGDYILDFLQGTGFMEDTILFYGQYFNKTFLDKQTVYNMSLAYLLATAAYFLLSLILMVRSAAKGFQENLVTSGDRFFQYTNMVFTGWDYALASEKAGELKKKNLFQEIKNELEEERRAQRAATRTTGQKCRLYTVRVLSNILVVGILGGSFYGIFRVVDFSEKEITNRNTDDFVSLLLQYLPSITITLLNIIVPEIFNRIIMVEKYSPEFEIRLSLIRTVFLRLTSIGVLLVSIYVAIVSCRQKKCGNCNFPNDPYLCWETYVGQQIYKLVILDFLVVAGVTIFAEFPRKLLVTRFHKNKLMKLVGQQEFDIPKNVLDVVYTQTLCWLGAFFSPLIPAITVLKCFILFYLKKWSLMKNCIPASKPYRAARSNFFFMVVLLLGFAFTAVLPIGVCIGMIKPSQSCGPFRLYSAQNFVMYTTITNLVSTAPSEVQQAFYVFGSTVFHIPVVIVLSIAIYYNTAITSGHKKMMKLLEEQLALEGKDKQFLLNRVNEAIQRGELRASDTDVMASDSN
ncbi:transmembrane channel-like protein 7 isoform X2 [Lingula anatina]|uniref:Transmembrane channel-like protein 7 isoform X2 n=1 Tax=Lingula anatina TaxID=7574 RepID=A0A1S3H2J8_LINAN|nr:transmembrane channel-like protein 7 isoform X2 [Lingula anatina]|eukprot:XP_013380167.1 transmembrane channel-like protein 7 isoform X2 [Lingula anatina]